VEKWTFTFHLLSPFPKYKQQFLQYERIMGDALDTNTRDLATVSGMMQEKKIRTVHWMLRAFSLNSPRGRIAACEPDPYQRSA